MHARLIALATLVVTALACDQTPTAPGASPQASSLLPAPSANAKQSDDRTPFQRSLMTTIAQRAAQGLPVPAEVSYEYEELTPVGIAAQAPGAVTIIGRTVLQFENVEQAGLAAWPALVVSGDVPEGATGFVRAGDYTQFAKDQIAKQYPDAWSTVSFETGPRVYTVAETLSVSGARQADQVMDVQLEGLAPLTAPDQLLLGFTLDGPGIDYHVQWDLGICLVWFFGCRVEVELVDFWAGFVLDWTIGMRLPMEVNVTSPNALTEGGSFPLTSAATGRDWNAADFEAVNVSPAGGNEYVLQFEFGVGVFLSVAGYDAVNLGVPPMVLDRTASFATPLGPGQVLTLPSLDIPLWSFSAVVADASIGLGLTPGVGSDRFTADWLASAEGQGSGSATYTVSGAGLPLGSVAAIDGPGTAAVQLSGFRYYFSQFELALGVNFTFHVLGYGDTYPVPVAAFDLSDLMGGLYVGPHAGTPGTLALNLPIENVAPTVTMARDGTVPINGRPTWLGQAGQTFDFTGAASDPGRDDLTLIWDWDDGLPAPDETNQYAVPHQVSESRSHTFGSACLYSVSLRAVDDDQAFGEDRAPVIVTGAAGARARPDGDWQHQLGGNGATDYTAAELECLLGIVAHMSTVFADRRSVVTIAAAYDVLFLGQNGGDEREQLDRQLLVAWLNFAVGSIGYAELVDLSGDGVADTPLGEAMAVIERARLDPATTDRDIRTLASVAHHISATAVDVASQRSIRSAPAQR